MDSTGMRTLVTTQFEIYDKTLATNAEKYFEKLKIIEAALWAASYTEKRIIS